MQKREERQTDERGVGLIWGLVMLGVVSGISASLFGLSVWQSKMTAFDIRSTKAFYFAEAGLDRKLYEIRLGNISSIGVTALQEGSYSVDYNDTNKTITATGFMEQVSRTIIAKITNTSMNSINAALNGNYDLSINGGMYVDGRDHDIDGNLIGDGTYGVSTSGEFNPGGNAKVGGNGIAPDKPPPIGTFQEFADPLPSTPEEILGLQPGDLDAFKTTTAPTLPMHGGIVYMTENAGSDTWESPDFGESGDPSWGIIIFHNSSTTATIRNLHGHFNGIIITDKLIHITGRAIIHGSVLIMEGNTNVGNGTAELYYSTHAIENVALLLSKISAWDDTLNEQVVYN